MRINECSSFLYDKVAVIYDFSFEPKLIAFTPLALVETIGTSFSLYRELDLDLS